MWFIMLIMCILQIFIFICLGCHVELTSNSGNISSPAFGVVDYPSNQECSYQIARPGGGPLSLRFNRFDVANDDFIEVFKYYSLILM